MADADKRVQTLVIAAACCPPHMHGESVDAPVGSSTLGKARRRRDHIAGRAAARHAIGHVIGYPLAACTSIVNDRWGIPRFDGRSERLSISHHDGLGLAAISSGIALGIDIEGWEIFRSMSLRPLGYEDSELECLAGNQQTPPAVFKCVLWVATEALGKSLGTGLGAGYRALQVADVTCLPWGWRITFQRYARATCCVWPIERRLVGLVIHGHALAAPAMTGSRIQRLIGAAENAPFGRHPN